jgi:hypothetical protein
LITRCAGAVRAAVLCGAVLGGTMLGGTSLGAQDASTGDTTSRSYSARRQEILKDIKGSQQKLDQLRVERLQLEARVETFALRQLDSLLTVSQDNLLAQRDRFLSLGEAVRRRAGAELVVIFRADSSNSRQSIDSVNVAIDNGLAVERHYSAVASGALANGAVDELYRSNVLPASHGVTVTVGVNGKPETGSIQVDAAAGAITYVQFALRNGQMSQSTWANRDNAPR